MSVGGLGVYPKLPRVAVRDSFADDEDDELSDIDDEVFVRDGKNGILKLGGGGGVGHLEDDDDYERGVKRPLMAPRRTKSRGAHFAPEPGLQPRLPLKALFAPFLYTMLGLVVVVAIIVLCAVAITRLPVSPGIVDRWLAHEKHSPAKEPYVIPCTSLGSRLQWTRTLPRLTSEAPLRSNDVNGDGVVDIIVGFSTGLDTSAATEFTCKMYFEQSAPCLGGVLALDGSQGKTLWTHWTGHAVFSVDCGLDVNGDGTKDCAIGGRGGILHAVSGRDGRSIWELSPGEQLADAARYYDVYDVRYIADMDYDGVGDVVAAHTWGAQSEVVLVSGKTGNRINSWRFPGKEQLFVAPQVLVHQDGETYLVLVASDRDKTGGLYVVPHANLLKGEFKLQKVREGPVSLPPLLIDVNSDGTEDMIVAMANSSVLAIDGLTFKEIWNFTIEGSEVISIPVPGYYNDDKVPDFMVKHQIGPGFPLYYYTSATVLDGKTGKPLLETPMIDTMSGQMSGLSITVDGFGNDWFVHWSGDCLGKEGARDKYEFFRDSDPDADLCRLRFNSSLVTSLYAFSQHVGPPGLALYRSEDWKTLEFNNSVDPKSAADEYAARVQSPSNDGTEQSRGASNSESEAFQKPSQFYPKTKDDSVFLDKALDDAQQGENEWKPDRWEGDRYNNGQQQIGEDNNYDDTYDDENERLMASRQLNEFQRLQRSEKSGGGRYINNDTNKIRNQLTDSSMDYTNGQNKQANYYTSLHFSRSNNSDDSSDYIPDIDFVDLKEAEALTGAELDNVAPAEEPRSRRSVKREGVAGLLGVQRQPPTGILLPSLAKPGEAGKKTVDLVFSTYWLPASSTPFVLLPEDLKCMREAKSAGKEREPAVGECLARRGVDFRSYQEAVDKENEKIALGQMTIYRMRLQCTCPEDMLAGQTCKDISDQQRWPEHLGASVSGYFDSWRK
ncbi:uncharacterized protein LOC106645513 [Copidosoma floridanum]|uniref:uncharacterized protein LOC106645513 n=1 Tax=Copidosoma floridanum TaxID=29053 RepID=UPI0006C9676E|nr:uncharacterized protein LOC106645513 [Copidosoma floridanum]